MAYMSPKQRLALVATYRASKSISATARQHGKCWRTVKRWVTRFHTTSHLNTAPGAGRPRALSAGAVKRSLDLLLGDEPFMAGKVAEKLFEEGITSRTVHRTTITRAVKKAAAANGERLRFVRGRPAKKLTAANMARRLAFCLANRHRHWKNVMFTDRKKFLFRHPGCKAVPMRWLRSGQRHEAFTVNHPMGVNVYAGITMHGVTKCSVVAGTSKEKTNFKSKKGTAARNITAEEYKDVLSSTLLPEAQRLFLSQGVRSWVLQQDNDPCHKVAAEAIAEWNKGRRSTATLLGDWPANSPDLNPIENVWAMVQRRVDAAECGTFEQFRATVLKEMAEVSQATLLRLYQSMPERMAEVIKLKGGRTRY